MSNTITIELCAEDRARLDRICAVLTHLADQSAPGTIKMEEDDLQRKLAETLAKADPAQAPKNATGEAKAETPADTQPKQEAATAAEPAHPGEADLPWGDAPTAKQEAPAKEVRKEDLRDLIITLSAAGKKDTVRKIVQTHCPGAKGVGEVPVEKYAAVYKDLTAALEG